MKIEGIEISHPDKIIFPDLSITKLDMVIYYEKIADYILPYLKDRPLTLERFPEGIQDEGFYQKHAQDYYPDFLERITLDTEEGKATEILCNNKKSIIYLANQGTVVFHVWQSKKDTLNQPDKIILDLDPSGSAGYSKLKRASHILEEYFQNKKQETYPILTGKRGIHICQDISPKRDFDAIRMELRETCESLVDSHPTLFTIEMRKNKRDGKIFLDYVRNAYGQTTVCPFSLRPTPNASVATPLEWREFDTIRSADQYTYHNIFRRLGAKTINVKNKN